MFVEWDAGSREPLNTTRFKGLEYPASWCSCCSLLFIKLFKLTLAANAEHSGRDEQDEIGRRNWGKTEKRGKKLHCGRREWLWHGNTSAFFPPSCLKRKKNGRIQTSNDFLNSNGETNVCGGITGIIYSAFSGDRRSNNEPVVVDHPRKREKEEKRADEAALTDATQLWCLHLFTSIYHDF